jgi:hypothetical protein
MQGRERSHIELLLMRLLGFSRRVTSPHRVTTIVVSALLILFWPSNVLPAQISPGPLSRAHQSLSGPLQCTSCHRLAVGTQLYKCLDCHTDIARRLSANHGYHATVPRPTHSDKDCVPCHSEHNGENFQLIRWEPSQKAFDHNKTGYVLEGKHAGLDCRKCHNSTHIAEPERAFIKTKDLNRTFLGLSRDCLSCHADQHRGQLGKDCIRCHTFNDWKKATGFNHAKTKFPLLEGHARVACEKCHKPTPADPKVIQYVGLAFQQCTPCHNDPHHDSFKARCETCHNETNWKQITPDRLTTTFDHSKTNYPLLGKHVEVRCEVCHHGSAFNTRLPHAKCADCHTPDPHSGQFSARKDGGACEPCHTVEGFKPSKFGVAEHADSAYPLEGKHIAVPCAKCHIPAGKATLYKVKHNECWNCHTDIHKGQFAEAPYNNRCESCHTVNAFIPSTFPLSRHSQTRFPLTGAHISVPCADCHEAKKPLGADLPAPYRYKDLSCTSCHTDPHNGQFAERMKRLGANGAPLGCESCHTTKAWSDIVRFDHSDTKFPPAGTHRAVACMSCHKPPNLEVTMKNVVFKAAPIPCEGCHEDEHAGQFAKAGKSPVCSECHNTNKWKPSLFDHETKTDFSLKGAHENVPCRDCHKLIREVRNKPVLFYKPTPRECAACHGANVPVPKVSGGNPAPNGGATH